MGSKKAYKYYCLVIILFLLGCSTSIKEVKDKNLQGKIIRVEINNNTYEVGITHIFKSILEDVLLKRGATPVEVGESIKVQINILDIKANPVSFDKRDIANSYNLTVIASIKIFGIEGDKEKILKEFKLSPTFNYAVKGLTDAEIERQLVIEKAAFEISSIIFDYLTMLP